MTRQPALARLLSPRGEAIYRHGSARSCRRCRYFVIGRARARSQLAQRVLARPEHHRHSASGPEEYKIKTRHLSCSVLGLPLRRGSILRMLMEKFSLCRFDRRCGPAGHRRLQLTSCCLGVLEKSSSRWRITGTGVALLSVEEGMTGHLLNVEIGSAWLIATGAASVATMLIATAMMEELVAIVRASASSRRGGRKS
jgi:hypothetical protein